MSKVNRFQWDKYNKFASTWFFIGANPDRLTLKGEGDKSVKAREISEYLSRRDIEHLKKIETCAMMLWESFYIDGDDSAIDINKESIDRQFILWESNKDCPIKELRSNCSFGAFFLMKSFMKMREGFRFSDKDLFDADTETAKEILYEYAKFLQGDFTVSMCEPSEASYVVVNKGTGDIIAHHRYKHIAIKSCKVYKDAGLKVCVKDIGEI